MENLSDGNNLPPPLVEMPMKPDKNGKSPEKESYPTISLPPTTVGLQSQQSSLPPQLSQSPLNMQPFSSIGSTSSVLNLPNTTTYTATNTTSTHNVSAISNNDGSSPLFSEVGSTVQSPLKKQRVDSDDMSFGFNNESFSDHKLSVNQEGTNEPPRIIYVSKLLIAGKSTYFRENMNPKDTTYITLPQQYNIAHFIDIIKWMYVDSFDTTGVDLIEVMTLAYKFKVKAAITRCASELILNFMNATNASKYIENEIFMRREYPELDETEFIGFAQLWNAAKQYLRDKFKSFDMEVWTSKDFTEMSVEGLKVVLASNELRMGTENTVFSAFRQWIHTNFEERKYFAAQLLPLVRFPLLQHNYLLDVVRTEADLEYPEEAKKTFAKQIIDAYVYHCSSSERRDALKELEVPPRVFVNDLLATKFYWKLEKISQKKEVWSESFFLGGYFLYLLMQRKNTTAKGGGTIGLYMHLKLRESGLGQSFYLPLAFELLVRNKTTKKYISTKGIYASPFTYQNRAWGYVDILGMTWEEFLSGSCIYNDNDTLFVKASVAFKDHVPKRTQQIVQ